MVKRRIAIIFMLICLCFNALSCVTYAVSTSDAKEFIDIDKECSLSLSYRYEETAFSDLSVSLYKIAGVSSDFKYTLTPAFQSSGLSLNGIKSSAEWNVVRSTLETYIVADGIKYDASVTTDENGRAAFNSLEAGLYLAVAEDAVRDDVTCVFASALLSLPSLGSDGIWQYDVSASAKPEALPPIDPDEKIEYKVIKLWKGDEGALERPETVEIEIFRDGISVETVILSEETNWSYSWSAKNDGAVWVVAERNVPKGYVVTVDDRTTAFVVTNTWTPEPNPPKPPQTGDSSNTLLYIIILNVSGIALILLGVSGKRRRV